jgi:hypothetical protein
MTFDNHRVNRVTSRVNFTRRDHRVNRVTVRSRSRVTVTRSTSHGDPTITRPPTSHGQRASCTGRSGRQRQQDGKICQEHRDGTQDNSAAFGSSALARCAGTPRVELCARGGVYGVCGPCLTRAGASGQRITDPFPPDAEAVTCGFAGAANGLLLGEVAT